MKGISPLIASVILITFVMAIGGVIATWSTTFSRQNLDTSTTEGECLGSLDMNSLDFEDQHITFRLRNVAEIEMSNLRATVEYDDTDLSKDYILSEHGIDNPIEPGITQFVDINTEEATKPFSIEVFSETCPRQTYSLNFAI